ncbi:MAG TPA: CHAT domain-containing protein [Candidatus Polarisedimenticolia bacterium]|nr:CHAT domain-containing protein [Candidatus Polarisedimenticolia bacterium]
MECAGGLRVCLTALLLLGASRAADSGGAGPDRPGRAEEAGRPIEAMIDRAAAIVAGGDNLFEAYRILRDVDPGGLEALPPKLLIRYHWALGLTAYELGRYGEVESAASRLLVLGRAGGSLSAELQGLYYGASGALADPQRFDPKPEAVASLREIAARAGPSYERMRLLALLALGKLLDGEEARGLLDQARALAQSAGLDEYLFHVRVEIARAAARRDPREGYRLLQEAMAAWPDAGKPWSVYGWEARLEIVWAALPRPEALAWSLDLLDRIEARRRGQEEQEAGSMGFFSVWVRAYRRVVGHLLRSGAGPGDLALVFELLEKMRGRSLLDELRGMGAAGEECAEPEAAERLRRVRAGISLLQRGGQEEPGTTRRAIDRLMLEEEALLGRLRCGPGQAAFATLDETRFALRADEAMIVFQTGNDQDHYGAYDGGSWALVVTRDGAAAVPLPEERTLRIRKDALLGALRRRDGSEETAAAALHRDVLRDLLRWLTPDVTHLIVIPHGPLHGLPLAPLRPGRKGAAVVERFRVTYAPSATLWLQWRRRPGPSSRGGVLALADPRREEAGPGVRIAASRTDLTPLPWARREARRLLRSYAGRGTLLEGSQASEPAVLRAGLGTVGLLVFATHAVIDPVSPRRSAIVLAAGEGGDDGLLQPPEIARLDLDGALVALSGCQSATGPAIEGEGLLSLARSFFEAGAVAVVGNLWPARDDEAGEAFAALYRRLAEGVPLAEALRRAQEERWREGTPAEAWAGIVALGHGDAVFPATAVEPGGPAPAAAAVAAAAGLGIAAIAILALRRRRGAAGRRGGRKG